MTQIIEDKALDLKKLRYVLYARKSSEDEGKQVRSLDDQIKDCEKLAKQMELNVVATLQEKKSAKKPHQRPVFTQMLQDLIDKKYDAIICWHPDRLSRNMLEGGQLIDMLDDSVLQDVRFHSHQFSNDANGKMLLGMLFVFSKQYSDDLSTKVLRGTRNNFSEGKSSGTPKFGYDRDDTTGFYERNEFFEIVLEAWQRRERGDSLQSVTDFLLEKGYKRITKNKKKTIRAIKPNVNAISKMFRDPFYYGVLLQAKQNVDLRELYDFEPMIDEETFNRVQVLGYGRTKDVHLKKRVEFKPLRGMVYCAVCNDTKYMAVGKNLPRHKKYHVLSYRCDNPDCNRNVKSMRAKFVFESIYTMLEGFKLSDAAYDRYSKEIESYTDTKLISIKESIYSQRGALSHIKKELRERSLDIVSFDKDSVIYRTNEERIGDLTLQQSTLERDIKKLEEKIADPNKIRVTKEEFLNLIKNASTKLKAGSAIEKDVLCRILFLNLRVNDEKVVDYIWREPFASLVKSVELFNGADERT